MKEIAIIIPQKAQISSVEDARYMFSRINEHFRQGGRKDMFNVRLVGLTKEVSLEKGLYVIRPDALIGEVKRPDLIIIPSINEEIIPLLTLNLQFNHWLIQNYRQGSEIASLCTGSFLLASTGLLNKGNCSTHWQYANEFRAYFPDVQLVEEKVITERNGIYTSGGATSYWNLLLHLVERYTDKQTAVWTSKYFALDISRNSQSPFVIFHGLKEHSDKEVLAAQKFIEVNFIDRLTVVELSKKVNLGRRTFERRFRKATNNSVVEYIQRVKVEAAKQQLETGRMTISEVMYAVGYNNENAFREVFRKYTAMSPIDYRNRYSFR